jgi:two-component system, OmpR family, alkaline phosphatase synthesis response regulator PhoP
VDGFSGIRKLISNIESEDRLDRRKVLLIEDDLDNQSLLKDILSDKFLVLTAKDGEEGFRTAIADPPDLILLDLMMPKLDGVETCGLLRGHEITRHIPVIVLTGTSDFEMQLKALDLGADDLLQKPFRPRELLARMSSKFRRLEESQKPVSSIRCADLEMDLDRFECRIKQELIVLSVLEFNLLRYFVENFNRVLSREEILRAVWREAVVTDRTVDTHMTSLRKKLQNSSLAFATLYGAGYILKTRASTRSSGGGTGGGFSEPEKVGRHGGFGIEDETVTVA